MKNVTDEQTVLDLEFDKILEWCSEYAFSERILLEFSKPVQKDFDAIHEDLSQIEELKNIHLSIMVFLDLSMMIYIKKSNY